MNESPGNHQDVKQLVRVELKTERGKGGRRASLNVCVREKCGNKNTGRCQGTHPDVAFAGEKPLRDASGVQTSSSDVKSRHEEQPAHLADGSGFDQTLTDDKVQGGNHAAQTQTHKHT